MGKKRRKKVRFSLFVVLIAFTIIPLVVSVSIASVTSIHLTIENFQESTKETLFVVANDLSNHCNQNKINYATAETYHDYIDGLKDKSIEMAIILNGAPCVASIKNENGYRVREIPVKDEIWKSMNESLDGYYDDNVIIDEKAYYGYYMPITVDEEIVGVAFAGELQENVTGATKSATLRFVGIGIVLILLFTVLILFLCKILVHSFKTIDESVDALSKGDLKKKDEHSSVIKEMNELLYSTRMLQENLSFTIGNIMNVSYRLAGSVSEVTGQSESSANHARDIAAAIQELSSAAMEMDENIQNINMQMQEIGGCINEISGSVDHLYNSSEMILQTNNDAKVNMDVIMQNNKKSVNAVKDISLQINETNDAITEIDKAVELILSIAEETGLLSLNASIEAARAGAFGNGFAVVADQIRELSEQSSVGAEMIKKIAKTMVEKSRMSVELADEVHTLIMEEQKDVLKTQEKYAQLSEEIGRSVNEIRAIAKKTDDLTGYKVKAIDSVEKLSAISEANTENNQNVSENIEQIVFGVQTVNMNCEKMNLMARELESSIAYFRDDTGK